MLNNSFGYLIIQAYLLSHNSSIINQAILILDKIQAPYTLSHNLGKFQVLFYLKLSRCLNIR